MVPERPEAEPGGGRHPPSTWSVPGLRRAGQPGRRGEWPGLALALVLLTGFVVAAIFLVTVVAPAGAAGGCGGG